MSDVNDRFDEHGNIIFLIDYEGHGIYFVARGDEENYEVVRKSESLDDLVEHVSGLAGDPRVIISDVCEILWSLEISDGREWWSEYLDQMADDCESAAEEEGQ